MLFLRLMAAGLALGSVALTGGCTNTQSLAQGEPDQAIPHALLNSVKVGPAPAPQKVVERIGDCDEKATGDQLRTCYWQDRDLIDYAYQGYKTTLIHAVNTGNFALDAIGLGLSTAGAITPGATASRLFSALAGAATGTKGLVDSDILYKQTVTIVVNEMDTDRNDVGTNNQADIEKAGFTWPQAVSDLLAYYEAGTFQHALVSLQRKSGDSTVNGSKPDKENTAAAAPSKPDAKAGQKPHEKAPAEAVAPPAPMAHGVDGGDGAPKITGDRRHMTSAGTPL